jgi:hypothetical protein
VRRVIGSGSAAVPASVRAELAEPCRERILELYARYQGHLGRVHEELTQGGAALSYPALTAFCRKHGIGSAPPRRRVTTRSPQEVRCSTTPVPIRGRSAAC